MIALILITLLLFVLAWAATQFLPAPLGMVVAFIIAILAVIWLIGGLDGENVFRGSVMSP